LIRSKIFTMLAKIRVFILLTLISLLPTLLIWLPFFIRIEKLWGIPLPKEGMATVVANYDGPLFLVVAKTLYNPPEIEKYGFGLPNEYYAAHFPLYPALIRLLSPLVGYPYSMLFITAGSSVLAIYFFYRFIEGFVERKDLLWITLVFSLLPARWLIVRSVGSAEPLFLATIIASVYYFKQKKFLLAGFWGFLAQLTKSPAILLFIAYIFAYFYPKLKELGEHPANKLIKPSEIKNFLYLFLIPLGLLVVFYIFKIRFNDLFAYFHSGDNIHLFFPPFQIFNYSQPWVGTFWLEEVIFVYLFGLLGLMKLIRMKEHTLAWFVGIYFISILFVSHRDIIRYALPIIPFLFAAFADTISKNEFKYAMLILIIPVYLFSLAYMSQNVMPISDWGPLL